MILISYKFSSGFALILCTETFRKIESHGACVTTCVTKLERYILRKKKDNNKKRITRRAIFASVFLILFYEILRDPSTSFDPRQTQWQNFAFYSPAIFYQPWAYQLIETQNLGRGKVFHSSETVLISERRGSLDRIVWELAWHCVVVTEILPCFETSNANNSRAAISKSTWLVTTEWTKFYFFKVQSSFASFFKRFSRTIFLCKIVHASFDRTVS